MNKFLNHQTKSEKNAILISEIRLAISLL